MSDLIISNSCLSKKDIHKIVDNHCGEDAFFIFEIENYTFFGVFDGVGGTKKMGFDPSIYSNALSKNIKIFIENEFDLLKRYLVSNKEDYSLKLFLTKSIHYSTKILDKDRIYGSSTVCLLAFSKKNTTLYSFNLGDSKCIVFSPSPLNELKIKVNFETKTQQEAFNQPFQLSIFDYRSKFKDSKVPYFVEFDNIVENQLNKAEFYTFKCNSGDLILVGSDGIWDNLYIDEIQSIIEPIYMNVRFVSDVNLFTNKIINIIKKLFIKENHLWRIGPWRNLENIHRNIPDNQRKITKHHSKIDDITIISALVV